MTHTYRVTVEPLDAGTAPAPIVFETENHDDLAEILVRLQAKGLVPTDRAPELAVALKLFGEVLLRNRKAEPFATLAPHFGAFMRAIKTA